MKKIKDDFNKNAYDDATKKRRRSGTRNNRE